MKRRIAAAIGCLALAAMLVPSAVGADERAMPIDGPDGETYYVYVHGGEFPTGHALEIWQETNGVTTCGVPEGIPVGHGTEPGPPTGLQVKSGRCGTTNYVKDTMIASLSFPES